MQDPATTPSTQPVERARGAVILLIGFGISFLLFTWARIWVIPPVLPYTPVIYLLFWVILWLLIDPKRTAGTNVSRLVALLAILMFGGCCVLYAPASGIGIAFEPWSVECNQRTGDGSNVRYLCRSSSYWMEFEGIRWLPFVRLDKLRSVDTDDPPPPLPIE